jgi:hypothetical protein
MKNKIFSMGTFVLLALLTSGWAADIFGNWIAQIPSMQGVVETVFSFRTNGARLIGTVCDPQGEIAISEGKMDGDEISFVVRRSLGGNEMKLVYKGKVYLNEIKFTREIQGGVRQPLEFIAKREFQRNQDVPLFPTVAPVSTPPPRVVVPKEPPPHK